MKKNGHFQANRAGKSVRCISEFFISGRIVVIFGINNEVDMKHAKKIGMLWLWCSLALVAAQAQKTYTEEEITRERMFLEAYEKKLIGKYDEAIALYEKVYEESPDNHAAAFELARIFDQQRKSNEAIRWMRLAQEGDPANVYYREFLAELLQSSGRFSEAAEIYEELAKKDGNDYYYHRWAYFLVRANEIDDAIKVYDELEKRVGINEGITRRKQSLYMGQGDTKKAEKELEKLVDAFPGSVDYRHLLATFYEQINENKKARDVYQGILEIDPGNAEALMALAGRSASSNNEIQYINSLKPAFEQEDVTIDLKIAKLLPFIQKVADTGDRELADAGLQLTNILERVHPSEAKASAAAGDLLFYTGRLEEARAKYQRTLELDESVYSVWEQLATTYLLEGDFTELLDVSNDGIDLFPNKAQLFYLNGLASLELGKYRDAQDMLDQAALMSGKDQNLKQQVLGALGEALSALDDFDGADRTFTEALEINEDAPETLARYSLSLSAREGAQKRALELAEKALKKASDFPLALQAQGMAFYSAQQYEKAKMVLEKALNITQGHSPHLLEDYGDVLYQLGEMDQALEYWQKARESGRQTKTLDKKINDKKI